MEKVGMGQESMDQGLRRAMALGREETIQELVRAGLRDRDYENLSTGERMTAHAESAAEGKRIVCD